MAYRVLDLIEDRDQALAAAKAITDKVASEDREMTKDEQKEYDAHMKLFDEKDAEVTRRERLIAAEKKMQTVEPRKADPMQPEKAVGGVVSPATRIEIPRSARAQSLKHFKNHEDAYAAGMWCRAAIFGDQRARQFCADHGIELRAQSESVNTAGGFIVPTVMDATIIDLREQYGVIRQNARRVVMASDHQVIPRRASGPTAYAIGEGDAITDSSKGWDQVTLTARKWGVLTKYSSEIAEDAVIGVAEDLAREIAYAFAATEDNCGFNGTGSSTYHGILGFLAKMIDGNHAGSYATAQTNHDTFAEIDATDVSYALALIPAYAQPNAKIFVSRMGYAGMFERLSAAASGNSLATLGQGLGPRYLGYPIVIAQYMPATSLTTDYSNKIMFLCGDMSLACSFGDRRGTTIRVSADRYLEYDQLAIVGTTRFDINVHDIGGASTQGPIVGLLGQ